MKWTPKVRQKTFGVYFMRKKHNHSALLKYMHMLEDGYFINYICVKYGISHKRLLKLWILYQKEGAIVLHRQAYTHSDAAFIHNIVSTFSNRQKMVTLFKVVTKSDQIWGFDKKKNPASVVYQLLTGFYRTQTRDRTGMGCPTGVWDQRVYRFRHLGICFSQMRCKGTTFFYICKTFRTFFEKTFHLLVYSIEK